MGHTISSGERSQRQRKATPPPVPVPVATQRRLADCGSLLEASALRFGSCLRESTSSANGTRPRESFYHEWLFLGQAQPWRRVPRIPPSRRALGRRSCCTPPPSPARLDNRETSRPSLRFGLPVTRPCVAPRLRRGTARSRKGQSQLPGSVAPSVEAIDGTCESGARVAESSASSSR